jgi:hypothetical protein
MRLAVDFVCADLNERGIAVRAVLAPVEFRMGVEYLEAAQEQEAEA